MPGRSPREAVHNFIEPLQRAFSCVTDAILFTPGGYYPGPVHIVSIGGLGYTQLRGPRPLRLTVTHHYRIIEDPGVRGPWKVSTSGYIYELATPENQRIVAYHWHPLDPGTPQFPHMHVGAGMGADNTYVKPHYPTGRVALEEMLRLAIAEFEIEPRRADWSNVLEESQAAFEEWRTWPQPRSER